jgi:hypothetical protein
MQTDGKAVSYEIHSVRRRIWWWFSGKEMVEQREASVGWFLKNCRR